LTFLAHDPQANFTYAVILGTLLGFMSRIVMLKIDYRQYPTHLHGKIIHLSLGLIAAALGSVAIPSLVEQNYTAITFLALAAQQFRDVRNMERETLSKVDSMELVPRGTVYIEGIALVFEGRNYLVIFVSLITSLTTVFIHVWAGVIAGIIAIVIGKAFMSGKTIRHIAKIDHQPVRVDGPDLYVGDIYIMNVGLQDTQQLIREHGVGFILTPNNRDSRVTLSNVGQRQAILHDVSTVMGIFRDTSEPSLVPLAKLDKKTGRMAVFLLLQDTHVKEAQQILEKVPLLEIAFRKPTEAMHEIKEDQGGATA
jgi:hypothetical protein